MLDRLPPGSRVAVIRLRSLGDCVLITPALSLLKAFRPDLRVGVVVEDRFAAVFDENPDVDDILAPSVSALLAWRPDLTINLHGGTRSMTLTAASKARFRAGFAHHRGSFLYTHKIPTAQEVMRVDRKVHTAEHVASALFFLGVPQAEVPRARLSPPRDAVLLPHVPAVFHPFASAPEKTWPLDRFLAVADYIKDRLGLTPLFLPGPGEPAEGFSTHQVLPNAPIPLLKSVMAAAPLFVGNDSGPAHIAAAFGVPSVVLFGPTDPDVWSPWRTEGRTLKMPGGIGAIGVEQVIEAVHALKLRIPTRGLSA